ncbi:MAG: DDE-type integrase/transposase/recombinase, partial [Candidatus Freyarchaeota archaeon]
LTSDPVQQLTNKPSTKFFIVHKYNKQRKQKTSFEQYWEWVWLWVALDPQRRVVLEVYLSKTRNGLIARSFMRKLMGKYGGDVVFVTDGGKWYPWAAESLGARWVWLRGGVRSYVERWFRTVKDRLRVFNCAFPRSPSGLERARTSQTEIDNKYKCYVQILPSGHCVLYSERPLHNRFKGNKSKEGEKNE